MAAHPPTKMDDSTSAPHTPEPPIHLVTFSPGDPEDPKNWSDLKKDLVLGAVCLLAFIAVFGSSSYAPGTPQVMEIYGASADVASLGLTLYVLGFAFGPLLWGPMSEMYGKKISFIISWILMILSIIPSGFADNLVVILVFRFFTGLCAAAPLSNGASVASDLYSDLQNLVRATSFFVFCALSGPCFGSLAGFFVAAHSGRILWVIRLHWFMSIAALPLVFICPETYAPTILKDRAQKLREAGQTNARAATEVNAKTMKQVIKGHVFRPFEMIIREPIIQGAALWISLAYGIIYFFFEEYPVVFIEQHGIPFQLCGLTFLGLTVGMALAVLPYRQILLYSQKVFIPGIERRSVPTPPQENSLKAVISACILMPISLFWFAWSSGREVHWISATLAGVPFGYSNVIIFFSFTSYVSHTYTIYASSAGAANAFVRSLVAAVFPVAAQSINRSLGTKWGVSLFGFLSLGLIPIPLIFIRYGSKLRERSHFAREAREVSAQMHAQANALLEAQVQEEVERKDAPQLGSDAPTLNEKGDFSSSSSPSPDSASAQTASNGEDLVSKMV